MARSKKNAKHPFESGKLAANIETVDARGSVIRNMQEYGWLVNAERCAPNLADGLITVQRALVTTTSDLNMGLRQLNGSAKIVGDTMSNYHPHGDQSIYQSATKLGQRNRNPVMLLEFQGNEGDIGGKPEAQMRYTEAKPTLGAYAMLGKEYDGTGKSELELGAVPMVPNYNNKRQMPAVLPARLPLFLIKGDFGVGVGIRSQSPCHNPTEVLNLAEHLLKLGGGNIRQATVLSKLPGPDFSYLLDPEAKNPVSCDIFDLNGGLESYLSTGQGSFIMQATWEVDTYQIDKKTTGSRIVFTSLPFDVGPEAVAEDLNKMIFGPKALLPQSIHVSIQDTVIVDVGKYDPEDVLPYLMKSNTLRRSFPVKSWANIPGEGQRLVGAVEALRHWLDHRRTTIRNAASTRLDMLNRDLERNRVSIQMIERAGWVAETVKRDETPRETIAKELGIDEELAKWALDTMTFSRLNPKNLESLREKAVELKALISFNRELVQDIEKLDEELLRQIREAKKVFGRKRTSRIRPESEDIYKKAPSEPLIQEPAKKGFLAVSERQMVRWVYRDNIERQLSGDYYSRLIPASENQELITVSSFGVLSRVPIDTIPKAGVNLKRHLIASDLELEQGEEVLLVATSGEAKHRNIMLVTDTGRAKAVEFDAVSERNAWSSLVTLDESKEDRVAASFFYSPGDRIGVLTSTGKFSILGTEDEDIKPKGLRAKASAYAKIAARNGGEVIWAGVLEKGVDNLVVRQGEAFGLLDIRATDKRAKNQVGVQITKLDNIDWARPVSDRENMLVVYSGDYDSPEEVIIDSLPYSQSRKLTGKSLLTIKGSGEVYAAPSLSFDVGLAADTEKQEG